MYNIKGPSKIVTKTTTRRGIPQAIDNYRDHGKSNLIEDNQYDPTNVSKPIFNKKISSHNQRYENLSPKHEEIIKFIHESWASVCLELDQENGAFDGTVNPQNNQSICYYEDDPCTFLQDFKPFDLESWWGKRLYAYVTSPENETN